MSHRLLVPMGSLSKIKLYGMCVFVCVCVQLCLSVHVDVCMCRESQLFLPAFTDRLLIECVDMHGLDAGKALDETRITA